MDFTGLMIRSFKSSPGDSAKYLALKTALSAIEGHSQPSDGICDTQTICVDARVLAETTLTHAHPKPLKPLVTDYKIRVTDI